MAVSTATYVWNAQVMVMASGATTEVFAEMHTGADSSYPILNNDDFERAKITYNGSTVTAIWVSRA